MQEHRVWTTRPSVNPTLTPLHIWDAGGEIWELFGSELRHYRVIDRVFLNKEMTRMKETLERMEESVIPKEIYAKHSRTQMKWHIEPAALEEEEAHAQPPAVWELTPLANWIPSTVLHPTYCDLPIG